ncbi:phage tail protein, partial [Escherichia coli]
SALPVGVPVPWPSATPPTGWLKCNGAPFSAEEYPELAKVYPTNKLPDLRGEFIRGWDDGRGVDTGRTLLSAQGDAIRNITGSINNTGASSTGAPVSATGVFTARTQNFDSVTSGQEVLPIRSFDMDISSQVPTASENRPRNIAFNFLVRAA